MWLEKKNTVDKKKLYPLHLKQSIKIQKYTAMVMIFNVEKRPTYNKFPSNTLDLDPEKTPLIDIHGHTQHPVTKNGAKITRPIVPS